MKLICGASNNDMSLIRNLCFIYTLASVDCIDLSVDEAVIHAALHGINSALIYGSLSYDMKPLIMVSVNDHNDVHFRKAYFNPSTCPIDCSRPCERVCPALAIPSIPISPENGIITEKCYGCGRCVPTCPYDLIKTAAYTVDRNAIRKLFTSGLVNALEVHTQEGNEEHFNTMWNEIGQDVLKNAKILAISSPNTYEYLEKLDNICTSHSSWSEFSGVQIWQADGRPMSGDIGRGTARASITLASTILSQGQTSSGSFQIGRGAQQYVQLAGGTNDYSIALARETGLTKISGFGGFGFGGYARKKCCELLSVLDAQSPRALVEDHPEVLKQCLAFANALIRPIKATK